MLMLTYENDKGFHMSVSMDHVITQAKQHACINKGEPVGSFKIVWIWRQKAALTCVIRLRMCAHSIPMWMHSSAYLFARKNESDATKCMEVAWTLCSANTSGWSIWTARKMSINLVHTTMMVSHICPCWMFHNIEATPNPSVFLWEKTKPHFRRASMMLGVDMKRK